MNRFEVIGQLVEDATSKVIGKWTYTECLIETSRPGKDNTVVRTQIPLRIFGNHVASRQLVAGSMVLVTGRIGAYQSQQGTFARVEANEIMNLTNPEIGGNMPVTEQQARKPYTPPSTKPPVQNATQTARPPLRTTNRPPAEPTPEARAGKAVADNIPSYKRENPLVNEDAEDSDDRPVINEDEIPF